MFLVAWCVVANVYVIVCFPIKRLSASTCSSSLIICARSLTQENELDKLNTKHFFYSCV